MYAVGLSIRVFLMKYGMDGKGVLFCILGMFLVRSTHEYINVHIHVSLGIILVDLNHACRFHHHHHHHHDVSELLVWCGNSTHNVRFLRVKFFYVFLSFLLCLFAKGR